MSEPAEAASYVQHAWLVTLPNGWTSVHIEGPSAINYAARNHGVCEALYRKVPAVPVEVPGQQPKGARTC